jgi:hypothetical protein
MRGLSARRRTLLFLGLIALVWPAGHTAAQAQPGRRAAQAGQLTLPAVPPAETPEITVGVGKSFVLDSQANVQRVSVADGDLAEAVVVNPREILINGKGAGETSLIIWQQGGLRFRFDLKVRPGSSRVQAVQRQLAEELPRGNLTVGFEDGNVYLRGTVDNLAEAERALMIAGTLGKPIDLLRVKMPQPEEQILLKVRFADIDRVATQELGVNFFSTGRTVGAVQTGQFPSGSAASGGGVLSVADALNVFLFNRDLNLAMMLKALETKRVLQILAEPNVLAINGKPASFLAGGEFPYPTLQGGGSGLGHAGAGNAGTGAADPGRPATARAGDAEGDDDGGAKGSAAHSRDGQDRACSGEGGRHPPGRGALAKPQADRSAGGHTGPAAHPACAGAGDAGRAGDACANNAVESAGKAQLGGRGESLA